MVYGLTGGTGSGKSTVSGYLRELGYTVIDADKISRELTETGSPFLELLKKEFGPEIIAEDGSLIRKKLGDIVFSDSEKLERLNELMKLPLDAKFRHAIDEALTEKPYQKVFFDAPTLLESNREDLVDCVWVVVADKERRIERIMKRDGITRQQVLGRMASQLSDDEKIRRSHAVIRNDGSEEDLKREVDRLLNR